MARNLLTPMQIKAATEPGRYNDGDGLALVVKPGGSRSWVLRMQVAGRRRDFGCGAATVPLAKVRKRADEIRDQYRDGLDPVAERKKLYAPPVPTFREAAERFHEANKSGWRNAKHRADWLSSLERYAYAKLGKARVDAIEGPLIIEALAPIWLTRPETARRVKQRIGSVLDWAYSNGLRPTDAPTGSIRRGLPKQPKSSGHFRAMPYSDVPAFVDRLRTADETTGRLALEFTILNAARSGETRGATWEEIDLDAELWRIPASRMKASVEHVVPLSAPALRILRRLAEGRSARAGEIVFPGRGGKPLSDMTLSKIMRDWSVPFDVHGFRSSFRDWAGERTAVAPRVVETALAHAITNKTEGAYHRSIYLDQRRVLMADWATHLDGVPGNVVRLAASA